ncbi:hypothetical protein FDF59_15850 [Clostridium botulinum]|nr:hypothetical protein [Clostridium botulinum]
MNVQDVINRTVRTSANQMCNKLTMYMAEQNGVELFETSAHAGQRPSHSEWAGQVFKWNK